MIKIGSNYLSLQNTSVEAFIQTAYDLRLDIVDFHQRAFTSTDPEYLRNVKLLCLRYGLPDRLHWCERSVYRDGDPTAGTYTTMQGCD
ncbi:MAG: hypothetical protein VCF25_17050 [Candidatus Poribacteria bacterium]